MMQDLVDTLTDPFKSESIVIILCVHSTPLSQLSFSCCRIFPNKQLFSQSQNNNNSDVCTKYQEAAKIVNLALEGLVTQCVPGAKVLDLCEFGTKVMEAAANKLYTKKVNGKLIDRGIAFPVCISVNNIVCNFSPLETEETVSSYFESSIQHSPTTTCPGQYYKWVTSLSDTSETFMFLEDGVPRLICRPSHDRKSNEELDICPIDLLLGSHWSYHLSRGRSWCFFSEEVGLSFS